MSTFARHTQERMHPADGQPTVFIVDDDPGVRKSLSVLIETDGFDVETFASALDFVKHCDPSRPGCLVVDLRMPGMSGLELQQSLIEKGCHLPVIFITAHGEVSAAVQAMKAGAIDFIEKPFASQVLLDTIHRALVEDAQIREAEAERQDARRRLLSLTKRQRQVVELLVQGHPTKAVAAELGMAKKTCDVHRTSAFRKLKVQTLADLARLYLLATGAPGGKR